MGRTSPKKGDLKVSARFHFHREGVIVPAFPAMLASLRIRNFALVESLLWEIPPGFVAITGETGAGKSILIGGLKLLLGERADKGAIRSGASECSVEAVVHLSSDSRVNALIEEAGAEPCEDGMLLLKRQVSAAGTGRQFVNGSPCTLALLRQIGDALVDLHGPHDHQSLFSRDAQMRILDAFAGARQAVLVYREARQKWLMLAAEKADGDADRLAMQREMDLLKYQVDEIDETAPVAADQEELPARHLAATHARRLRELAANVTAGLSENEPSVESGLLEVGRIFREMTRLDVTATALSDRAGALLEEVRDLASEAAAYAERVDEDPATLAAMEARLDAIESLKRKYGSTVEEILAFRDSAADRLGSLTHREARRDGLDAEIAAARKVLDQEAGALGTLRRKAAPKLADAVRRHLNDLGFLKAGFEIRLDALPEPGPEGVENVEFVFSPNPGEPSQPLRAIASSGEISRVMLALKTSLAAQDEVPILVFDEIDANVGGEIARSVAGKMREIGGLRQVLCITHLPQVAAGAAAHFVVKKSVVEGRTVSSLDAVGGDDREQELARMLGDRSGQAALAHARELLGQLPVLP